LASTAPCALSPEIDCVYLKEPCPAAQSLYYHCSCREERWECFEDNDCYPPSTCVDASGGDCVYLGEENTDPTGSRCPEGTALGVCTQNPCRLDTPGRPPICVGDSGEAQAVCVFDHWHCPLGYRLPE